MSSEDGTSSRSSASRGEASSEQAPGEGLVRASIEELPLGPTSSLTPPSLVEFGSAEGRQRLKRPLLDPVVFDENRTVSGPAADDAIIGANTPLRASRLAALLEPAARSQMEKAAETLEAPAMMAKLEGAQSGARLRHLPMMRSPLKSGYLRDMQRELQSRSDALRAAILSAPEKARWNVVVVGAGPHGTSAATVLREQNRSCLVVEASDVVSANFGKIRDAIRINSAVRADDGEFPQPGKNNINPIEGPIKVPDLVGARWPGAGVIADASQANLLESGAQVLFNARIIEVAKVGELGYTLTTEDGLELQTEAVIWATGLGQPQLPFRSGRGLELAKAEVERFQDVLEGRRELGIATIATYPQAMAFASSAPDPLAPYRDRSDGRPVRTLVIGEGDSAYTFFEHIYRLNSDSAYMNETQIAPAQLGNVGPSTWIVGDRGYENCREFVAGKEDQSRPGARGRYASLSSPLRTNIKQVKGRATEIERLADGRFRVTVERKDQGLRSEIADRVIVAAGFEETPFKIPALLPPGTDAQARIIRGRLADGEDASLGLQLGIESIFVAGPATGPSTVPDSKTRGIPANKVSLFNNTPRVAALTKQVCKRLPERVEPIAVDAPQPLALLGRPSREQAVVRLTPTGAKVDLTSTSLIEIEAYVIGVLSDAVVSGASGPKPQLKLSFEKSLEQRLDVVSRSIQPESLQALGSRLAGDPKMVDMIDAFVSKSVGQKLKLTIPLEEDGSLRIQELKRSY